MPQIIFMIVCLALSFALAPKPPKPKPAALGDFDFPQTEDGTPQCMIFGDCWVSDWMVLGVGNLRSKSIRGGGK